MANETESRVVELQFNNRQFEANVSQTLKTLDNLKESLKFEGAEQGFKDLDAAADKLDLSKLDANVEKLANRFTLLGTAADLVRNKIVGVADSMISTTASTLTSFSAVANLGSAWDQYAEKTSSVQTIMAATRQEFAETGNQMEIVESELDKLTWFTDETSHKFLDLVNNIGKFTSNNIGLHSAVDEMMGIATWASISGASTTEAARAMYNLSQAMSMGALTLNDWKSIENANMATVEFKQTAIDTAVELGTLTEVTDGVYQAMNGAEVTIENFRETLTDSKWLNNNVLEATLTKYGGFSTKLNALYENLNASGTVYTSTLLDMIEAEKSGADYTETFNEVLESTGVSAETLKGAIETLASEENDLGYRAFKASQETKTFGEAIDYVRTAVTSGWAQSFETIFGNYEEAKALWTGFADTLYDIFVASGETRNAILDLWKAAGGRDALFGTEEMTGIIQNLAAAFETIIGPAKAAWENIFPPLSVRDMAAYLLGFTEWLRGLTEQFGLSEEAGRGLEIVLTGLLSPLKLFVFILKLAGIAITYLFAGIGIVSDKILSFIAAIYDGTISLKELIANSLAARIAIVVLGAAALLAVAPILALGYGILTLIDYISSFDSFGDWLNQMRAAHPVINTVVSVIERFINAVINIPSTLRNVASSFVDFLTQFDSLGGLLAGLAMAFVGFGKNIVQGLVMGIASGISWAVSAVVSVFTALKTAFMSAAGIHSPSIIFMAFGVLIIAGLVIGILSALAEVFAAGGSIGDALISGFSKKNVVATFKLIGDGIITVVKGIIFVLAAIPYAVYLGVRAFIDFIRGTDTLKASLSNTQGVFSRFGQKLLEIFSTIRDIGSKSLAKVRQFLEPVNNFFKRFFDNLTAGQIVVFAISVALITLSVSISKLLKGFSGLGPAVTGLLESLGGLVDSLSAVPKAFAALKRAEAFKTYAVSIAILAGSLIILAGACSGDNMENIIRAGIALGVLAAGILAFSAILALITKISSEMPKFSFAILGLAVAVGVLSRIFSEMQGIEVTVQGLISFLLMCSVMIGMMVVIDKLVDNAISGGMSMLLLAMSIKTLCKAFIDLNKDLQDLGSGAELWESIGAFAAICLALGALMVAMSSVDVKSGIGALAGILALKMIISILAGLNESVKGLTAENAWGQLLVLLPTILEIGAFLLIIAFSLKLAGNALLTAGIGMLAGIFALKMALATFTNMTQEELQQALPGVQMLGKFLAEVAAAIGLMTLVWGVLSILGADFKGLGRSFLSLSLAIGILVGCMKLMEALDPSTIELFAGVLEGLMVFMGIAVLLAGFAKDAHKGINAIRNFMIAFVACVAILTLFQTKDGNELLMPMLSICAGIISLAVALFAASKLTEKVKMAPIIAMIVGMAVLSATLIILSRFPWENVAASGAAMTAALLSFAYVLKVLSDMDEMKPKEILTTIFLLVSVMGILAASVYSLMLLSSIPWESLVASAGSLVAMLLTMGHVCNTLAGLGSDAVNAVIGAAAMTILAVDLLGMALALQMLNGLDMVMMLVSAATLSAMLLAMGGVCRILGGLGSDAVAAVIGAAAMTILVVDILGLVLALHMLNGLDMTMMLVSAGVLLILLSVMALVCAVLAGLGATAVMAVIGAAAMTILVVDILGLALALAMLNGLDMTMMLVSAGVLVALLAVMAGIVALLSLLGPMVIAAIPAALAMTILAADMIIMAVALSMLNTLDMNALVTSALVLGGLMVALGVVVALLSLLGPMVLAAIPAAIAMTILAADLLIVAQALSMLNDLDMEAMTQSAISLAIVMGAMTAIVAVLSLLGTMAPLAIAGAIAMTILAADLLIVAKALSMLNGLDMAAMQQSAISLAIVMGAMTAIVAVLSFLGVAAPLAIAGAIAMTILAADLLIVAQAFSMLNTLDMQTMTQSAISLGIIMAAMVGIVTVLGLIGTLSAAAIVGAIAMTILSADLVIIAQALAMIAVYDPAVIQQAAMTMLATITSLVGVSVLLATVSPAALIGAATLLAMAVALQSIGRACLTFAAQTATIDEDMQRVVDAISTLGGLDETAPKKAEDIISVLTLSLSDAISTMRTTIEPEMEDAGEYFIQGLENGLSDTSGVYAASYALGDAIYMGLADRLGIHSPSTVGEYEGAMYDAGVSQGLDGSSGTVYNSAANVGQAASDGMESKVGESQSAGQLHGEAFDGGIDSTQPGAYVSGQNEAQAGINGALSMTGSASAAGSTLGSALYNAFMSFVNTIKSGLERLAGAAGDNIIGTTARSLASKIGGMFGGVSSSANAAGEDAGNAFGSGLFASLKQSVADAKEKIFGDGEDPFGINNILEEVKEATNGGENSGGGGSPGGGGGSGGSGGGSGGSSEDIEEEEDAAADLIVTLDELNDKEKQFAAMVADTSEALDAGTISQEEWNKKIEDGLDNLSIESGWLQDLVYRYKDGFVSASEFNSELQEIASSVRSASVREWVAELTALYKEGKLSMEEYNARVDEIISKSEEEARSIEELNEALQNGTIKLDEYNQARAKLADQAASQAQAARYLVIKNSIDALTDAYNKGELSQEAYEVQVQKLLDTRDEEVRSLEDLNYALQAGTISMDDYASAFQKVVDQNEKAIAQAKEDELRNTILGIGTASTDTSTAIGIQQKSIKQIINAYKEGTISAEEYYQTLQKLAQQSGEGTAAEAIASVEEEIRKLTATYDAGQIGFGEYCKAVDSVISQNGREQRSLEELRKFLTDGTISINEYNEALKAIQTQQEKDAIETAKNNVLGQLAELQRKLAEGELTLAEYNGIIQSVIDETKKETRTVTELNQALKQGAIDSNEYAKAISNLAIQEKAAQLVAENAKVAEQIELLRGRYERSEITLKEYKQLINDVISARNKETRSIADLDKALANNLITLDEYNEAVRAIYAQEQEASQAEINLNNTAAIYGLRKEYEAGTITLEEYVHQLGLLSDKTREEQRSLEQLEYLLQHSLITNEEYIEAVKAINAQEKERDKVAKEGATAIAMEEISVAYQEGKMSLQEYNAAIQKAQENADRETRSIEELKRALHSGTIDVNEFATAIKNLAEQEESDKQANRDRSIRAQIHNIWVEYEKGAISEEEYLDGVDKIIRLSKKETRTLKELDYQLQNNLITYDEYNTAIQELYEADNDLTLSLKEMAEQERNTGKRSNEFAKVLKRVTIDTWGFSDALLDVSTVLRFTGRTFLNFYDTLDSNPTLAEAFGVTEFVNGTDAAIQATEQLMLDFYKMQNPTDLAIQEIENYGDIAVEVLDELKDAWVDYVETAYNAIMGNYDVFNAPGWFEKEILSPDKLLENQNMYIEGERSFVEKMGDLAGKLDSEMWMSLYEGGSKNLEQVIAFWQMTDEELAAFNEGQEKLREYAKQNAEKLASISVMVYQDAGYDAIQAFVHSSADAVDIPTVEEEAQQIGKDIGDTIGESMAEEVKVRFTEDMLKMSYGTLLKLFEKGIININEACELMFAKPDEYLWTLDDYSIDEGFFTEQGIKYIRAIFDGTASEVEEAHENLVMGVTALTPYDEDLSYSSGTQIGEYFDQGIATAVETYIEYAVSAVEKLADAMIEKLEEKIKEAQARLMSSSGIYTMSLAGSVSVGSITASEFSTAVSELADRVYDAAENLQENVTNVNENNSKFTSVTVNQNIDAQPQDAYIIAQQTGNTIRGALRKT